MASEPLESLGPRIAGLAIGDPMPPLGARSIFVDRHLTLQASAVLGGGSGVLGGYDLHHRCADLAECVLAATTLAERIRGDGYDLARTPKPPPGYESEWMYEGRGLWLSLGVWQEPDADSWKLSVWVHRLEPERSAPDEQP